MTTLDIPELALVVLIGVTGSGKSTFARAHWLPSQVLSSDAFRLMVADDENDQSASADAFEVVHFVAGKRLAAGRLTVVDATNVQPHARASLVRVARDHDVLPVAIVLNVPESVCWARTQGRPDRDFGRNVVTRQASELRRSIKNLGREGFRKVYVLQTPEEIDGAVVRHAKLFNDRKDLTGPFDIIGDVHGCRAELEQLLETLGWQLIRDRTGRAVNATHPQGRTVVFVGDLVDRGPDSPGVLRLVMGMVAAQTALCVSGNHEQKLLRKLRGRNVTISHGLAETLAQLEDEPPEFTTDVADFIDSLISHYVLDGGRLVVAHAGLKEAYHGRASGRVRSFALYGDTTGETDEYGLPVRYPWANEYRGRATVVYGHTPTPTAEWVNNTICLDTGCVFGGALTALRYPERELVGVPAGKQYYEPVRPLTAAEPVRDDDLLDVSEVTGRRYVPTKYGRFVVPADNAAAALEVMGRFAVDPRALLWLPPTMAPGSTSSREGYLEHPADVFADYRAGGVETVICEEKHMGSRAVVLVGRDETVTPQAIYTRTGRPFFADTADLLGRVRAAAAPLFEELATQWLLLDCELLPWGAKALSLIKEQYASVGAAARSSLPAAMAILDQLAERGIAGASAILARFAARHANADRFTDAYRRYVGQGPATLAPFAVLASAGRSHAGRDHGWHLAQADRLVAADPATFTATQRRIVSLSDQARVDDSIVWWTELTDRGGEGAVIKPWAGLAATDSRGTLLQPGMKCRSREYLRIIYGPDYTEPEQLSRLRDRHLGRKRGLALREHALGLEALDLVAAGAPLWRVHQLVFAILASESEAVDPRL
jgi:polynucleotide kinase-phosphatase